MTERQSKNPLHGITLEMILNQLVSHYGWEELGRQINIRCFTHDPSVASSLKFLRRNLWAREKVESLYLDVIRTGRGKPSDRRLLLKWGCSLVLFVSYFAVVNEAV